MYCVGYGEALTFLKRYDDAEKTLLSAHARLSGSLGETHAKTLQAVEALVKLYETWDKPEQAARWRARLSAGGN